MMTQKMGWVVCVAACALALVACEAEEEGGGGDTAGTSGSDATSGGTSGGTSGATADATSGADGTSGGDTSGAAGCGEVTELGVCEGNTLKFCRDGELITADCASEYFEAELFGEVTGTCQLINDSYGYDCVVATGDVCVGVEPHGDHNDYFPVLCAGSGQGCVQEAEDQYVCKADIGACEGDFTAPFCLGEVLVVDCAQAQPIGFDCAAMGGKCEVHEGEAVCGDLPEGTACEVHVEGEEPDHQHGGYEAKTECAAGLVCSEASGTCIREAPTPAP